jgi:hypothetical protein
MLGYWPYATQKKTFFIFDQNTKSQLITIKEHKLYTCISTFSNKKLNSSYKTKRQKPQKWPSKASSSNKIQSINLNLERKPSLAHRFQQKEEVRIHRKAKVSNPIP